MVTETQLLVEVTASCPRLMAIQRIVNRWFYMTVNNFCKQL